MTLRDVAKNTLVGIFSGPQTRPGPVELYRGNFADIIRMFPHDSDDLISAISKAAWSRSPDNVASVAHRLFPLLTTNQDQFIYGAEHIWFEGVRKMRGLIVEAASSPDTSFYHCNFAGRIVSTRWSFDEWEIFEGAQLIGPDQKILQQPAWVNLGIIHPDLVIEPDFAAALTFYEKGAALGSDTAKDNAERIRSLLNGAGPSGPQPQ